MDEALLLLMLGSTDLRLEAATRDGGVPLLIDDDEEEEQRMLLISSSRWTLLLSPRFTLLGGFRRRHRRFALLPVDTGIDRSEGGCAAGGEGEALPQTKMLLEMGCG
ncbi:hypothetical protein ACLOJK_036818 [Asimina triloba]